MTNKYDQATQKSQPNGCLPTLFRLYWLTLGNLASIFFAILIAIRKFPYYSDALYWLSFLLLLAIRYIDIVYFKGQTYECEPATLGHWYQYSQLLFLIAVLLYMIAQVIASLIFL